jgi:hypothetical protein
MCHFIATNVSRRARRLFPNVFGRCDSGRALSFLGALLAALLFLAPASRAQVSASLSGRVIDPASATVSGATVAAVNMETGEKRSTVTDDAGRYWIPAIPVGEYEVHVTKANFQEQIQTGIHFVVGQEATVDFTLRLGQVSEQVKVNADAPVIDVTPTEVSGLVGERQVKDLPLNGRSYDTLMTLDPGVVNFTWEKTGGTGVSNSTAANMFSVAGNRPQQNMFLLNGVEFTGAAENNMQPGGTSGVMLGVDAVREFNLLTNAYSAEYGKHPGGQVTIITQGGTNDWHGSVFEYVRNNIFDAANSFDQGSAPPFRRNQFGAAAGGPIQKDKTFFFANYEGFRQSLHQTSTAFVPDNDVRNCIGTSGCSAMVNGAPVTLGSSCPAAVPQHTACLNEVWNLLNLWPVSNVAQDSTLVNSGIAKASYNPLQSIREDFGTLRADRTLSAADSLAAVYTIDDSADQTATAINPFMADTTSLREQVLSLEETHTFSPVLLNTLRFGFSRAAYFFTGEPTPGTPAATLSGFLPGLQIGAVVVGGSAASNPMAQIALAGSNNGSNLNLHRNLFTWEDQVAMTHGRNQFKLGVWFQRFQSNENIALSQYGQATFPNLTDFLEGTFNTVAAGKITASGSFLIDPASTPLSWRSLFSAFYAEDVVRLSPKLTLSVGLRGEFSTGWNEAYGRAANFTFTNGVIDTQPHVGTSAFTRNRATFLPEPRIGLAWSPIGRKTVLRAAFGMYNDLQDALGYRTDQNAPFNTTYTIPNLTLDKFPLPLPIVPVSAGTASPAGTKIVPGGVQPDLATPTLISYSLKIEQEISPNTSVTVGYLGSHGYHELVSLDANVPPQVVCPAAPCTAGLPAGTLFTNGTARANPLLANTYSWFSEGNSLYNALTVDVNHRFSKGLTFRGSYTWSKALDNGDSLNATAAANAPALVANPLNIRADWGPATYDVRNVGAINVSYELPIGQGKQFGAGMSGLANGFAGGWTVNSIVTVQSGFPFTPQLSFNPSNDGDSRNPVRPSWNPAHSGPVILGTSGKWFDPSAFVVPTVGTFGNVGRNVLTGPGLGTWDFSVMKNTHLAERFNLQFRAEIFNLLNRVNLDTPNLIVYTSQGGSPSPVAGTFTSTSTSSRQVQFGLKLLW